MSAASRYRPWSRSSSTARSDCAEARTQLTAGVGYLACQSLLPDRRRLRTDPKLRTRAGDSTVTASPGSAAGLPGMFLNAANDRYWRKLRHSGGLSGSSQIHPLLPYQSSTKRLVLSTSTRSSIRPRSRTRSRPAIASREHNDLKSVCLQKRVGSTKQY